MPPRKAFTLLELLAVLALFGLISGLVAMNHDALLPALRARPPEAAVRAAIRAGLRHARDTGRRTTLRYEAATAELVLAADDGEILEKSACGRVGKTRVRFVAREAAPEVGPEAPAHALVEFSPAGYLRPVAVELTDGDRRKVLDCDPLSGVLTERAPEARP